MSYCVNCGVKLAASEEKCPLCNTVVINPNETGQDKKEGAYSPHFEDYSVRKINVKYLVQIILSIWYQLVFVCHWCLRVVGMLCFTGFG